MRLLKATIAVISKVWRRHNSSRFFMFFKQVLQYNSVWKDWNLNGEIVFSFLNFEHFFLNKFTFFRDATKIIWKFWYLNNSFAKWHEIKIFFFGSVLNRIDKLKVIMKSVIVQHKSSCIGSPKFTSEKTLIYVYIGKYTIIFCIFI